MDDDLDDGDWREEQGPREAEGKDDDVDDVVEEEDAGSGSGSEDDDEEEEEEEGEGDEEEGDDDNDEEEGEEEEAAAETALMAAISRERPLAEIRAIVEARPELLRQRNEYGPRRLQRQL
jgi:hypothetical protein